MIGDKSNLLFSNQDESIQNVPGNFDFEDLNAFTEMQNPSYDSFDLLVDLVDCQHEESVDGDDARFARGSPPQYLENDAYGFSFDHPDIFDSLVAVIRQIQKDLPFATEAIRGIIFQRLHDYNTVLQGKTLASVRPLNESEAFAFIQLELQATRRNAERLRLNEEKARYFCNKAIYQAKIANEEINELKLKYRDATHQNHEAIRQLKICINSHAIYNEPTVIPAINNAQKRLITAHYPLLRDLALATRHEIMTIRGIGPKTFSEIIVFFESNNLACMALLPNNI